MKVGIRRTLLVPLIAGAVCGGRLAGAQGLSESTGVAQYFVNCARCHESSEIHTARGRQSSSG